MGNDKQKLPREDLIKTLIQRMGDPDSCTRWETAMAIGKLGPEAAEAVPALIEATRDTDLDVCYEAVDALGRIGPAAGEAIPVLLNMLDPSVFDEPGQCEAQMWYAATICDYAAWALSDMGAEAARGLADILRQSGDSRGSFAATALENMDSGARSVVHVLIELLSSECSRVRLCAVHILSAIGPGSAEAVPTLMATLSDADDDVRASAAIALGNIGPDARQAVPALAEALMLGPDPVQHCAAHALSQIGCDTVTLTTAFDEAPRECSSVRASLAHALRGGGREAISTLMKALQDDHGRVRRAAAESLGVIGLATGGCVSALCTALGDEDVGVRRNAIRALWRIRPQTESGVSAIVVALADQDSEVRWHAARGLAELGPSAIPALTKALDQDNAKLRKMAAMTLNKIKRAVSR
ncbi:MAG: HEAT repeat domain-containing protein [Phycisphaerae bacterium]|nr:HEAT repeat domain-containing protein [Phycisphaerae bacterium]